MGCRYKERKGGCKYLKEGRGVADLLRTEGGLQIYKGGKGVCKYIKNGRRVAVI